MIRNEAQRNVDSEEIQKLKDENNKLKRELEGTRHHRQTVWGEDAEDEEDNRDNHNGHKKAAYIWSLHSSDEEEYFLI